VKLEHIGIAVSDIDASKRLYEQLFGAKPYKTEEVTSEGVITHFYDAGGTKIELLESTSPTSVIGQFLERHGPGMHHMAFSVDDLEASFDRFEELGLKLIGESPKEGADGKWIFFVHPSDTHGVLMEFCSSGDIQDPRVR
jgi:methylmalonyl-CoA/ethylmalonyl-CoA epimerase